MVLSPLKWNGEGRKGNRRAANTKQETEKPAHATQWHRATATEETRRGAEQRQRGAESALGSRQATKVVQSSKVN